MSRPFCFHLNKCFVEISLIPKKSDLSSLFSKSGQFIKESVEEILQDKQVDTRQLIETCLDKIILLQNEVENQKSIQQALIAAGASNSGGNTDEAMLLALTQPKKETGKKGKKLYSSRLSLSNK